MRIVVVGASGRTGKLVAEQLKKAGHDVVGTIRNPKQMAGLLKAGVEVQMVDLETSDLDVIEHAFAGADGVVFAAGSGENESSAIDRKGVQRTVRAAMKAHARRYVAISSLGASTPLPEEPDWPGAKEYFAAKKSANRLVEKSSLFWTIIEPGTLTDGKGTGKIAASTTGIPDKKIPRADVAAVVVKVLDDDAMVGRIIQVVGGATPIATALKRLVTAR
jgi:uncharacterized protein YbjT (DUF2867 family)